jgi:MFS family permease
MGPLVGGFVTQSPGWKWSQWSLAIIAAATYVPVLFLEETYLKIILARRQRAQHIESIAVKPPASTLLLGVLYITLLRPMKMLAMEPIVTLLSAYVAFNFAVVFTFFGSIPYVYTIIYGFDRGQIGMVFLGLGLGCVLAVPTYILVDKYTYMKEWNRRRAAGNTGLTVPEQRLWPSMIGAFGLPIGLFWYLPFYVWHYKISTNTSAGLRGQQRKMCTGSSPSSP